MQRRLAFPSHFSRPLVSSSRVINRSFLLNSRRLNSDALPQSDLPTVVLPPTEEPEQDKRNLTPKEIVAELDRYIIGQAEAKKAVANAFRNRWRRLRVPSPMKEEIIPKNILMIGPTGVGKTEIARRMAKMTDAPFIKVEATKFTEVGYVGKDVDTIIKDLVDVAINQTKQKLRKQLKESLTTAVEEKILDILTGSDQRSSTREVFREQLKAGVLDSKLIEIESKSQNPVETILKSMETANVVRLFSNKKKVTVKEGKAILEEQELEKRFSTEAATAQALEAVQEEGIVFLDEIDKVCTPSSQLKTSDASSEGVQRDLLPLIEGTIVNTKHGNVDTSKILFIASGAFHSCKPSDLLAELQGRLPVRVELKGLTENDLYRILTEPVNNILHQQTCLLGVEGIQLTFNEEATKEIARFSAELNSSVENIGARRLHTVVEKLVEEISFNCEVPRAITIDLEYVKKALGALMTRMDLSKYLL